MSQYLTLKADNAEEPLVNNYRPVQKLHQRIIQTNVSPSSAAVSVSIASFWVTLFAASVAYASSTI